MRHLRRYFRPTHWIYLLLYTIVSLIGIVLVNRYSTDQILVAVGTSLIATGVAGWILYLWVMISQGTAERLEMLRTFGFVDAFPARSVQIKTQYDDRLADARERIDILGFGLRALREDYAKSFADWARRAEVRILLVDPEAPTIENNYAQQRDLEENNPPDSIKRDVDKFIEVVEDKVGLDNTRFQVKLYSALPSINVFRIDDETFWGPYFVGGQSRNLPTFIVSRYGILFENIVGHFEEIWSSDTLSRPASAYRESVHTIDDAASDA